MNWKALISIALLGLMIALIGCDDERDEAVAASVSAEEEPRDDELVEEGPADQDPRDDEAGQKERILLFANLDKADSACGCGQLIRLVEMTGERGAAVEKIDIRDDAPQIGEYEVDADPTILFVDSRGEVLDRFEGEEEQTIVAIRDRIRQSMGSAD